MLLNYTAALRWTPVHLRYPAFLYKGEMSIDWINHCEFQSRTADLANNMKTLFFLFAVLINCTFRSIIKEIYNVFLYCSCIFFLQKVAAALSFVFCNDEDENAVANRVVGGGAAAKGSYPNVVRYFIVMYHYNCLYIHVLLGYIM